MELEITSKVSHVEDSDVYNFKVGDIVKIQLTNGCFHEVICVEDTDDTLTFLFKDIIGTRMLHHQYPYAGVYEESELRVYMNTEFKFTLPQWILDRLVGEVSIPCFENIFGEAPKWSAPIEGKKWELFQDPNNIICFSSRLANRSQAYWVKNTVLGSEECKGSVVDYVGAPGYRCRAYNHIGVRPYFVIRKN